MKNYHLQPPPDQRCENCKHLHNFDVYRDKRGRVIEAEYYCNFDDALVFTRKEDLGVSNWLRPRDGYEVALYGTCDDWEKKEKA